MKKEERIVPKTTCRRNDTPVSGKLYLAFELSEREWKLGFTVGLGQAPRLRNVKTRHLEGLQYEIKQAKARFGSEEEVAVLSCYEARRDGFSRTFANDSSRVRRIGIVALAYKLLIALWRYVEEGILPDRSLLKGYPSTLLEAAKMISETQARN